MDTQQLLTDVSPISEEPTTSVSPIPETENEVVKLIPETEEEMVEVEPTVEADDSDVFFGNEAPRSPLSREEKVVEKVSFVKEIVQAEFALWTIVYALLLTKVWSHHRLAYRLFNYFVVTPFILWIAVFLTMVVPSIVITIRISWSIQRRLFGSTREQPPSRSNSDVVTLASSHKNSTASGAFGRADFTCSYSPEQVSPALLRERLSTMPGSYRRQPMKRRLSFHA